MSRNKMFLKLILVFLIMDSVRCKSFETQDFTLAMPNVRPFVSDIYVCTVVRINPNKTYYVVGFQPKASMNTVHHMILYGCLAPGLSELAWDCGEMSSNVNNMNAASPCADGSTILYAWARDAPKLELPEDVAFKVGYETEISYLVLQVHYNSIDAYADGRNDSSGVILEYTEEPLPKLAGVLLLGTNGVIRPLSTESMETACTLEEDKVIHPFAYRVHTHENGVRVAGYRIQHANEVDYWTLIGERDPLDPQMFYPVNKDMIIAGGDSVAATCKMDNKNNYAIHIGHTSRDEMCNFYLMYWVDDTVPLEQKYCFSLGSPYYYWDSEFNNIPSRERLIFRRKQSISMNHSHHH